MSLKLQVSKSPLYFKTNLRFFDMTALIEFHFHSDFPAAFWVSRTE